MQDKNGDKAKSIGFRIRKLDNQLKRNMQLALDRQEEVDEITSMNGFIIQYLYQNEDKTIYQRDIEQKFKIGKSAVTNVLTRMEENGLIEREVERKDARLKKIRLTQKGKDQQKIIQKTVEWLDLVQMEQISSQEREVFFSILEKIENNVSDVTKVILSPGREWIDRLNHKEVL